MTVSFEKIEQLSTGSVQFYTARIGDKELTEFELFVDKDFPDHVEEIQILYAAINIMKEIGAKSSYFIFEGSADALPIVPQYIKDANKDDWGVRLYCIRLTDDLVVLLNGDVKTVSGRASDCPNVKPHITIAIAIANQLDKLLGKRELNLQEADCLEDLNIEI